MKQPIAIHVTGIDAAGRPVGVLLGPDRTEQDEPVTIMPGMTRFSKDDTHHPRFPIKVPIAPPACAVSFHILEGGQLDALAAFVEGVHQPLPRIAKGDVVHAEDCRGWNGDNGTVAVQLAGKIDVVGPVETLGEADRRARGFIAASTETAGFFRTGPRLAKFDDVSFEAACEAARHEPDTALVAAWLGRNGDVETLILAHTGAYLFHFGGVSCEDAGMRPPDSPGLFALRQANPWGYASHEGEHDSGIDGDLVAVTPAEAATEFDFDAAASVAAELDGQYPYDYDADIFAAIASPAGPERDWGQPASPQP